MKHKISLALAALISAQAFGYVDGQIITTALERYQVLWNQDAETASKALAGFNIKTFTDDEVAAKLYRQMVKLKKFLEKEVVVLDSAVIHEAAFQGQMPGFRNIPELEAFIAKLDDKLCDVEDAMGDLEIFLKLEHE